MVDSSLNEGPKNFFFREVLISGEGRPENLGNWPITGTSIIMQNGGWSISKENISPYPLVPKSL